MFSSGDPWSRRILQALQPQSRSHLTCRPRPRTTTARTMNTVTVMLLMATAVLAASGYRAVRTSGPLPVTVHVRAGGVMAGGPAANRTSAGGIVFPAPVASMTSTPSPSTNAAAAAAAGFTSFSTSSSASNQTTARNQTRSERLRARLVYFIVYILGITVTLQITAWSLDLFGHTCINSFINIIFSISLEI